MKAKVHPIVSDKEIFDWIQQEITATRITKVQKVVGYEEHLEPNPEMGVCEGTFQPTTRDRQHIIVYEAIYDMVDETVLDEKRAAAAAMPPMSTNFREISICYFSVPE